MHGRMGTGALTPADMESGLRSSPGLSGHCGCYTHGTVSGHRGCCTHRLRAPGLLYARHGLKVLGLLYAWHGLRASGLLYVRMARAQGTGANAHHRLWAPELLMGCGHWGRCMHGTG